MKSRPLCSTLRLAGVEMIDDGDQTIQCQKCGIVWRGSGPCARQPWWRCPNGCNAHIKRLDETPEVAR